MHANKKIKKPRLVNEKIEDWSGVTFLKRRKRKTRLGKWCLVELQGWISREVAAGEAIRTFSQGK